MRMVPKASVATEVPLPSALVSLDCPLMMKGRRMEMTREMKRMTDAVTSVRDQLYVKATMIAATMVDKNSRKVPSFSDIPSCKVLAVEVMVLAAVPEGIESST